MKEFMTLTDVKINNTYDYIKTVAPTVAQKAPDYTTGQTWLNTTDGLSYTLVNAAAGTWVQIETAIDAKINRRKESLVRTVLTDLNNYFIIDRNGDFSENYETQTFPQFFNRKHFYVLFHYECVWSDFTFAAAGKTITVGESLLGALTDSFKTGDTILIKGSRRNDEYYTLTNVTATELTVSEDIQDGSANCFIFLADVPAALIDIIGRMLHYDVYIRGTHAGLSSERIGTYSYTLGGAGGNMGYPDNVVAGINSFEDISIGGLSVFVN